MKRKFFCLLLAMSCSVCGFAQQTDPLLTGAVTTQTEMLKKLFKKREKTQEAIIATEAGVTLAMERMHHWRIRCWAICRMRRVPCRISIRSSVPRNS